MTSRPRDTEIRRIGRQLRLLREKPAERWRNWRKRQTFPSGQFAIWKPDGPIPALATLASITNVLGVTLDELVGAARAKRASISRRHRKQMKHPSS